MKTLKEIYDEVQAEVTDPNAVRYEAMQRMKQTIQTKLKVQGPPPPQVVAGVNTQHIMALFRYVFELIYASATDDALEEAWKDFDEYREADITARHYDAYVQTEKK